MRNYSVYLTNSGVLHEKYVRIFQCKSRERERDDIFKPAIRIESSHEIRNDNGVTVVKFATSKNLFG
jgi:hypothetical protein